MDDSRKCEKKEQINKEKKTQTATSNFGKSRKALFGKKPQEDEKNSNCPDYRNHHIQYISPRYAKKRGKLATDEQKKREKIDYLLPKQKK